MTRRTPSEDDDLALDRQVCFPLYAASNLITRLYRPALARLGLTYPQYLVMLVLWEAAPQSVGSLGERLHLDSGTLTPLLKRLETAGLVVRRRDPADERRVLVELTDAGKALKAEASDIPRTLGAGLGLGREDLDGLRQTVGELVDLLAAHSRPGSYLPPVEAD
ncbi:MarR family winged helix-turn-helix transcriptional regulator [Jiella mangrovi]|uniref:MarR family transcriptional regulator n=1 Tax=Jiella mangrovi TaxID=2821407 RepID=A0ABS4BFI5_9HYPH|nr:MarR family transcriptional regulator [Jiella mangrovi]MBP0615521.1 MarR family transcriptional regulator [Jiella mangrovi]